MPMSSTPRRVCPRRIRDDVTAYSGSRVFTAAMSESFVASRSWVVRGSGSVRG